MKTDANIKYILIALIVFSSDLFCQFPAGGLHRQISRASNFQFAVYNSGLLYGDYYELPSQVHNTNIPRGFAPSIALWPRGYNHMGSGLFLRFSGVGFLAKRNNEYIFREASSIGNLNYDFDIPHGPFYGMVPGRIGDPKAGTDEHYNGIGWKYYDDRDYIIYSSLDFDSNGVDISGNNYNDWPIRVINGKEQYVANYLDRIKYPVVFKSDEDFFTVYKDTDTRSYRDFQTSRPLELEVHQYIYTWSGKGLKNVVLYRYDYLNKGNSILDSCYFVWDPGVQYIMPPIRSEFYSTQIEITTTYIPQKDLTYQKEKDTVHFTYPIHHWYATKNPPILSTAFIEVPSGYSGEIGRSKNGGDAGNFTIQYFVDNITSFTDVNIFTDTIKTEEIFYRRMQEKKFIIPYQRSTERYDTPFLVTTPFRMHPGDTARFVVSLTFTDDTTQMYKLNDLVKRVFNNNFKTPSPPVSPVVTAKGLNRGVYLEWDKSAESSIDPIIPSDESKPFVGYRVYRSAKESGLFKLLKEWKGDTHAHDYFDQGEDIGGLKNNVTYYYKVTSFDEGDSSIELESMESESVMGKNLHAVAPTVSSSNITSPNTQANAGAGTLGDIQGITFVPTNVTNYRTFFESRNLQVNLTSITNGVKYLFPVTIKDTVHQRTHNDVIDIGLNVHGTNESKGIKQGTATVTNIFGLGGANLEIDYSFEQLADSFLVTGAIQSNNGADVPIILKDSLNFTGITEYSPYTSSAKTISVRFTGSGVDTASILFNRRYPYLIVELYDESTGNKIDTGFTFSPFGVRTGTTQVYPGKPNRYYLTGTLSNNETWEFGHILKYYNTRIVFDYADRGVGSGKTGAALYWGSMHKSGTKDFSVGDRVNITWAGGVKVNFPKDAVLSISATPSFVSSVTDQLMDKIRIVPNPYLVRHEAQRGNSQLYFNYLPEECTIRIYTIALDLVKTIYHSGGSHIEWDLQTEGGQQVASQMLYAYIEAPNGAKTIKKFSVIVGK
ncbi:MAG: fibronectin type III domain-containing protein [Bacteroidota bacterium]